MANRRTGTAARSGGRVQTTQTRSYRSAQTARSARSGVQMTRTYIDGNTVRKVSYAEPVRRQPEAEAIAGGKLVAYTAFGDDEASAQDPDQLADMGIGRGGQGDGLLRR